MKFLSFTFLCIGVFFGHSQDYHEKASNSFRDNEIDSARFYINRSLRKKPSSKDYFLSGMIHEAENKELRAVADYEAAIQSDPYNVEAYFQKGLIYYNTASPDQAIKDFTYVIDHQGTETKAVYYRNDPFGSKGTFVTTLESLVGSVYQFRGLAYQKVGELKKAMNDFNTSFEYDTLADFYVNRALLYSRMNEDAKSIDDLKRAVEIEPENYLAWYNLAILDESAIVPFYLLEDEEFTPMLNLLGANAYEQGNYVLSAEYHAKAILAAPEDDFGYLNRGKSLLRSGAFGQARQDFLHVIRLNPSRIEAFYLIGNTFFHEKKYEEAIGFYERYLSIDAGYKNVWYNAAMSYLEKGNSERACVCLRSAESLGMVEANALIEEQCDTQ